MKPINPAANIFDVDIEVSTFAKIEIFPKMTFKRKFMFSEWVTEEPFEEPNKSFHHVVCVMSVAYNFVSNLSIQFSIKVLRFAEI